MVYYVGGVDDDANPTSITNPPAEAARGRRPPRFHERCVAGLVQRKEIARADNYGQAGECCRAFERRERDDLIKNLVDALRQCNPDIQERMVQHLSRCDPEYGARVAQGIGIDAPVPAATPAGDD